MWAQALTGCCLESLSLWWWASASGRWGRLGKVTPESSGSCPGPHPSNLVGGQLLIPKVARKMSWVQLGRSGAQPGTHCCQPEAGGWEAPQATREKSRYPYGKIQGLILGAADTGGIFPTTISSASPFLMPQLQGV